MIQYNVMVEKGIAVKEIPFSRPRPATLPTWYAVQHSSSGYMPSGSSPNSGESDMSSTSRGGGPHLDRVVFESIPDNTSRVAALTGGELSGAIGLVPDDLPSIEQNPDLTLAF